MKAKEGVAASTALFVFAATIAALGSGCGKCESEEKGCINRNKIGVVFDRFNREDSGTSLGNSEGGLPWTATNSSVFGINGGQAYMTTGSATGFAVIDANAGEVLITLDIPVTAQDCGLVFRYVDTNNYWFLYNNANTMYRLARVSAGTLADIVQFNRGTDPTPKNGDGLSVDLVDSIALITPMVNSIESAALSITDGTHQANTKYGFGCRTASTTVRFDNFAVLKPNRGDQ